jgi:radical SAM protein with 4Fe4S-binding SPASM domain
MQFIVACRQEGRIHASFGCEGFLGPWEGQVRDHLFSCQAGLSIASVRVDGAISGCTSIRGAYSQGNIYQDDFVEVWEQRFGLFRDHTPLKTGPCADCRWWKWCQGNGMHLRDSDGRLLQCNLERLGVPVRQRQ